jgi:hypothetical protein
VPTHNDPGGAIVYVWTGSTTNCNWTGGTLSSGAITTAKCWAIATTYPGMAMATITNRANDRNVGHRVKIQNMGLAVADPAVPFNAIGKLWFADCDINSPGASACMQLCTNIFVTGGRIRGLGQGIRSNAGGYTAFALVRGVNFDGFGGSGVGGQIVFYTFGGNTHPSTNGANYTIMDYNAGISAAAPDFAIFYNNNMLGSIGNPVISIGANSTITNGIAVVGNVFEDIDNTGSPNTHPVASIASSGAWRATNVLWFNNNTIGERTADIASNASETDTNIVRQDFAFFANVNELNGFKKDIDGTHTNRTANWNVMFLVGSRRNIWAETLVNSAAGGFPPDSLGLNSTYSSYTNDVENTGSQTAIDYLRYRNRKAYAGDAIRAPGGGDYRFKTDSPAHRLAPAFRERNWATPHDFAGKARGAADAPGAPANPSPAVTGFF